MIADLHNLLCSVTIKGVLRRGQSITIYYISYGMLVRALWKETSLTDGPCIKYLVAFLLTASAAMGWNCK